MGKLKIWAP